MIATLIVTSPLIATSLVFMWLWLRAEDRAYRAERERDDLLDGCLCVETDVERLTKALGCHPGTRENDGTPCASGLHSPALWGANGCTWVAEVAECLGEMGVGT